MLTSIIGAALMLVGLFLFLFGPGDRVQIVPYTNMARVLGLILIIVGVVMIKL